MTWQNLTLFFATSFFLSMIPGPNMLLAMSLGLRFGVRRTAWGGLGMCTALAGLAGLSALGLGALLATSAVAFNIVKWAGVAYLAWLGIAAWRAPVASSPTAADAPALGEAAPLRLALRGFLVAVSNPKALVFMAALFPQFIDPAVPVLPQFLVMVIGMVAIEFGWIMTYAAGGHTIAARLANPRAKRGLNRVTGGLMLCAGGLLALARQV
ncbi:MAG: LysE family translocator [Azospirillaceae bacterium]|nr:LysE family translocator [Azospirillaceae bacterium]